MNNDKPKTRSVMHTSLDVENSPRLPGGKIILCDGCHFSFEVEPGGLPYCIRCRRMATHLKVALALREPATEPKWPDRIKELQFGLRLIIEKAKYDEYGTFEDVRNRIIVLAEEVLSSDAALALRDVSQGQWIDVEERVPEIVKEWGGKDNKMYGESAPVLVFDGSVDAGQMFKSGTWVSLDNEHTFKTVTHWQPLPAAPLAVPVSSEKEK